MQRLHYGQADAQHDGILLHDDNAMMASSFMMIMLQPAAAGPCQCKLAANAVMPQMHQSSF
jgi:hypothetical protein